MWKHEENNLQQIFILKIFPDFLSMKRKIEYHRTKLNFSFRDKLFVHGNSLKARNMKFIAENRHQTSDNIYKNKAVPFSSFFSLRLYKFIPYSLSWFVWIKDWNCMRSVDFPSNFHFFILPAYSTNLC